MTSKRFFIFLKKILYLIVFILLIFVVAFFIVIIREGRLYNLPNKASLNHLALIVTYEKTPFVYIRKSGSFLGNIPSYDTPFFLGDITKIYTTTLILQLHEQGKLNLDDPVSKHYRHDALPFAEQATLRQLLSHRSGLIDQNSQARKQKIFKEPGHTFTLEEIIKDYTDYSPAAVGIFNYSDTGYYILGRIIEKVTGNTFEEYLYSEIINRLGLKNTCVYLHDPDCRPVQGYVNLESLELGEGYQTLKEYRAFMTSSFASGYLAASPQDLTTFMKHVADSAFFDFTMIEQSFIKDEPWTEEEKRIGGRYGLGMVDFGKNRYGYKGGTVESTTQVIIEKETGEVYLHYFGEPGLLQ